MPKPPKDYRDSPVYWFAILDIARASRDEEKQKTAIRELARLGITVSFSGERREVAR